MTTPDQLATSSCALLVVMLGFMLVLALGGYLIERRLRRQVLPPPQDPHRQNDLALAQYRARIDEIERLEVRDRYTRRA